MKGVVDAADADAAIAAVSARGLHVLEVKESSGPAGAASIARKRVTRAELALFTRRLADLARAGVPLDRSLRVAGEQSENDTLRSVTEEAVTDVHSGLPVSEALAKHPKLFPAVFTMTLRAGEASGQFPQVATRLAEFQQIEVKRRGQIMAALIYPSILLVTAVGVVIFIVGFVVPRLSSVFNQLGSNLPLPTTILLTTSAFITNNALAILIVTAGAIGLYRAWVKTVQGATMRDAFLLRMPILGKVISRAIVSRYARVLGTLLYGGVPILESLQIAGAASGNRVFETSSRNVQQQVREGRRVSDAMQESGAFSSILVQMVAVGEETGDLPGMLTQVSETLDFEVENGMQKLTALVEPLIVLTMGAFVGLVVLSVILPIYQAQELVK